MGLKVINPLIKAVAKKAYVAPKMEVRTLESLGLKMEQLSGDVVKISRKTNITINPKIQIIEKYMKGEIDVKHVAAILRDPREFEEVFSVATKNMLNKKALIECKSKILAKIDRNIANHGSIVMQSYINPTRIKIDPKTGIRYVELTQDDIVLAHSVQANNSAMHIEKIIDACKNSENKPYLSLSLNNKNSEFFCFDSKYGIVPKNRSINVTSAGYGQGSGYGKSFDDFIRQYSINYSPNCENNFIHDYLINNLKQNGINLTEAEYVQLYKQICHRQYFNEITEDFFINGKRINASVLRNAVEESHSRLTVKNVSGSNSVNEVTSIIDDVDAIYARVDNISEVDNEIIELIKKHPNLKIFLTGKPKNYDLGIIPEYQQELNNLKQLWINKQITISEMFAKKGELNNRYSMVIAEQLRPRTYLEQNM